VASSFALSTPALVHGITERMLRHDFKTKVWVSIETKLFIQQQRVDGGMSVKE
jgi:hypothetical protein